MVEIVQIDESAWEQLRALRLTALQADPSAFGSNLERELAFGEDRWRAWPRESQCFLALDGATAVGMVSIADTDQPGVARLVAMWVDPEHRSAGVGGALVESAVAGAQGADLKQVVLFVVAGNDAAVRLYEDHQFFPTGRTKPLSNDPRLIELEYSRSLV